MSQVLGVLLVGILVLVYCTSCSTGPVAERMRKLKSRIAGRDCKCKNAPESKDGMTVQESIGVVKKLGSVFDREDTASPNAPGYNSLDAGDHYDPINMGALKQTEIDAHKRGIAEMAPFNSYGPAGPNKTIRDDDEILRNTGVPWVGGRPRMLKKVASGPQAGARSVPSASEKDIYQTHIISASEPTWG